MRLIRGIADVMLAAGFAATLGLALVLALVSIALFGFKPEEGL